MKTLSSLLFSSCSLIILLFMSTRILGQQAPILAGNFISSTSGLTSVQLNRWQIIDAQYPDDVLYAFPEIDFSLIGADGRFKLSLPGGCQNVEFKTVRADFKANGDLNFMAYAEERDSCECNCNLGDFTYTRKDGIAIGMIRSDEQAYEIRDLKEGKLCLRTVKAENITCIHEGYLGEFAGNNDNNEIGLRAQCCVVRILILHDAAANVLGDIAARAEMDIMTTNQALFNSTVGTCNLTFQQIGAVQMYNVPNPTPTNAVNDLRDVQTNNQALRNQVAADIVVFYTAVDYLNIAGAALGLENPVFVVNPAEDAYALVEATAISTARLTFAHEVGHLFQCRHENDPGGTFQHGHSFKVGCEGFFCIRPRLRTILHTDPDGFNRVLHYSNPHVKFRRKPTGVNGSRYNALQLNNTGCTVAAFRVAGDPLMATISGPCEVCLTSSVQFFAEIAGDAPQPYIYVWETATSILGPYQTVGSNASLTLYGSGVAGEITYIRLTVTSSDNQVAEEFHILECVEPIGINCGQFLTDSGEDELAGMPPALPGLHWSVFPNPAGNDITLGVFLEQPYTLLKIHLLDQNGKLMDRLALQDMKTGRHNARFDLGAYPPGIYLLRMMSANGTKGKTIIKH